MASIDQGNKEFEASTGVPRSDVSRFKHNKSRMGIDTIDRIAHAFPQLSIDWLLYGRGDMLRREPLPEGLDRLTFELAKFLKQDEKTLSAALKFLQQKTV